MPRLSRKEKLRKEARLQEKRANDAAREEEAMAMFATLPAVEQKIVSSIWYFWASLPGRKPPRSIPTPKFFEDIGITGLDERRALYILWSFGLFKHFGDQDADVVGVGEVGWIAIETLCELAELDGLVERFVELLSVLELAIPGLEYECLYTKSGDDYVPQLFFFSYKSCVEDDVLVPAAEAES
jgi:hypothetical protein